MVEHRKKLQAHQMSQPAFHQVGYQRLTYLRQYRHSLAEDLTPKHNQPALDLRLNHSDLLSHLILQKQQLNLA
jgi:hypothetical protein